MNAHARPLSCTILLLAALAGGAGLAHGAAHADDSDTLVELTASRATLAVGSGGVTLMRDGASTTLSAQSRAHASASVLPDGRVLVFGGEDARRHVVESSVVFDPRDATLAPVNIAPGRTGHAATVLTDGRVLIVGGATGKGPSTAAVLWDFSTRRASSVALPFALDETHAELAADGRVRVAGTRASGKHEPVEIVFDPLQDRFVDATADAATNPPPHPTAIAGSLPQDGASDVAFAGRWPCAS